MIKKTIDTVLNVRPIFVGIQHLYFYEGPCRFGEGEELMPEYDAMMNQEMKYQLTAERAILHLTIRIRQHMSKQIIPCQLQIDLK